MKCVLIQRFTARRTTDRGYLDPFRPPEAMPPPGSLPPLDKALLPGAKATMMAGTSLRPQLPAPPLSAQLVGPLSRSAPRLGSPAFVIAVGKVYQPRPS